MSAGLARCGSLDIKAPKILAGDFQPGGKVDSQVKDLRYIMQMARKLKVSLPVTAVVNELFHAVQYVGRGEWDQLRDKRPAWALCVPIGVGRLLSRAERRLFRARRAGADRLGSIHDLLQPQRSYGARRVRR